MRLSDYDKICGKIVRDGAFNTLGLIGKMPPECSLGYVQSDNFLEAACHEQNISCIVCPREFAEHEMLIKSGKGIAVCEVPRAAFIYLHNYLVAHEYGYCPVYQKTQIGEGCNIHPMASISETGVIIGNHVTIEEFSVIREGSRIGDHVTIHSGAIIGADNYDFCWDKDGHVVKMKQVGQTYLADHVEIGCHTIVGRAPFSYEKTVIGENTCIESLVTVSHACRIGKECYIGGKVNICGSVTIEDSVRINPMATIKDSVTIGEGAVVSLGGVVVNNVKRGTKVTGNFAIEHSKFLADHWRKLRNR